MIVFTEIGQLLKIVLNQFLSNFFSEAITLTILSIVLVIILIVRSELSNYFETKKHDSKSNTFFNLLIEISFPLFYFGLLNYISCHFQNVRVSFLIFNSFIYLYFGFIIVKYSKNIPSIHENSLWIITLYVLIVIASISHLFTNLSLNFYDSQTLLNTFLFVLENSVKYVFFIILFRSIRHIIDLNHKKFGFTGRILKNIFPFMYFIYLVVIINVLWLIVIVKLNYSIFIGLLSIVVFLTIFALAKSYITPLIKRKSDEYSRSYQGLDQSLLTMVILFTVWAFYNISLKYFKFGYVVNYLNKKHLIITDLVEISYFSLIYDAFLFLVLLSLIGLLKNLVSLYETSKSINNLRRS